MTLEIRDLRLVVAVAAAGTLTRAGEELHLTQSALSHQLRRLEEALGVRLFSRHHRRMRPTAAGERLLRSARTVLAELADAEKGVRESESNPQAVVRLTTECYTCYEWLPAVLRPFRQRYPGVRVEIDTEATRHPLRRLAAGSLDLAVMSSRVSERSFAVRHLFEDELMVIVSPDHPLAAADFVRPADLAGENILLWVQPQESTLINRYLKPAGVRPASVQIVGLTEAVVALVEAGAGVGFLARWAVRRQIEGGTLRAVPITRQGCRRQWSAVMPRAVAAAAHVQQLLQLLAEHAPVPRVGRLVDFRRAAPARA